MSCCCSYAPESVDVELSERAAYLEMLRGLIQQLDNNITTTINNCRDLTQSIERVATNFSDISMGSNSVCQQYTKEFLDDMRKLQKGNAVPKLQGEMKTKVRNFLSPFLQESQKTNDLYKSLLKVKKKYDNYNHKINKTVKKYAKENKELNESKTYTKTREKCDKTLTQYNTKKAEFFASLNQLRNHIQDFLKTSLCGYAAATSTFANEVVKEVGKFADKSLPSIQDMNGQMPVDQKDQKGQDEKDLNAEDDVTQKTNPLTLEDEYYQGGKQD